jgi:UDP-glucose 4-epimerase
MSGRRVLVTGISEPLGRAIAERMATRVNVDIVIGASRDSGSAASVPGIEVVDLSGDYTGIADLLRSRQVDTIIHADRSWSLSGSGRDGTSDHVIATMQLAAAAAHREATVRRVVMVSSTRVYPASARAPLHHSESESLQPRRGSLAAALVEAEGFVRDLATANPNLSVSILRFAELAGPGTHDPLARLLASPVAPAVWGFDPPVQLLHVDDAVAAVVHATNLDLAGVYNVAADGLVRWRRAARLAHTPLIELAVTPSSVLTTLLRWSYRLDAADDILAVLRYGRSAATDAVTRSGFQPSKTSEQCVLRSPDRSSPPGPSFESLPSTGHETPRPLISA